MNESTLNIYANYFKRLNRGYNKDLGRAPHKPILLISLIELIQKGSITSNRIYITSEFVTDIQKQLAKGSRN